MSDERQEPPEIPAGILFLALTRPPIMPLLGLPHGAALLLIVAAMETVIFTHGFWVLPAFIPVWGVLMIVIRNDYNFFHTFAVFCQGKLKSVDVWRWGGASLSPFPLKSKAPRGIVPL